jgi:hypothetical protein
MNHQASFVCESVGTTEGMNSPDIAITYLLKMEKSNRVNSHTFSMRASAGTDSALRSKLNSCESDSDQNRLGLDLNKTMAYRRIKWAETLREMHHADKTSFLAETSVNLDPQSEWHQEVSQREASR